MGETKVSCILLHWGVQLRLAILWARPTIFAAGKGRGGKFSISFVSSLSFIFLFPPLSLSFISTVSLLPFSGRRHKMSTMVDVSLNSNTINQYLLCSKGSNSKSWITRATVQGFCTSSYGAVHLWEILWKYLKRFSTYRVDTSTW